MNLESSRFTAEAFLCVVIVVALVALAVVRLSCVGAVSADANLMVAGIVSTLSTVLGFLVRSLVSLLPKGQGDGADFPANPPIPSKGLPQ